MGPIKAIVLSMIVLSIAGCASPIPVAHNFPLSYQKVARTAKHWDIVADDVVEQTASFLASREGLQGRAVFVPGTQDTTAFDATFHDFLINHLVDRGLQVSVCSLPGGVGFQTSPDVQIKYEKRIISHGEKMPQYQPGVLTALAAGVLVVRSVAVADLSGVGFAAAALADLGLGHLSAATQTEMIVTTTIVENNRFAMRRSDIYYVPDGDIALFTNRITKRSECPPTKGAVSTAAQNQNAGQYDYTEKAVTYSRALNCSSVGSGPELQRWGVERYSFECPHRKVLQLDCGYGLCRETGNN